MSNIIGLDADDPEITNVMIALEHGLQTECMRLEVNRMFGEK